MNQSQTSAQPAHADQHSVEDVKRHVRQYLIIGAALMLGTALTVWASLIDFGSREINIVVALVIATAKGFLVVGFFMHLLSEKKMIYSVLAMTVFFFTALLYLTLWSMARSNAIQIR